MWEGIGCGSQGISMGGIIAGACWNAASMLKGDALVGMY